ncbi:MAG: hypothetical protein D4S01_05790 [Dehalococcoidia bacterium]|nr:MAG: hypothetical protein D4S01_05790 [Dehalococcoidia bacterium]
MIDTSNTNLVGWRIKTGYTKSYISKTDTPLYYGGLLWQGVLFVVNMRVIQLWLGAGEPATNVMPDTAVSVNRDLEHHGAV